MFLPFFKILDEEFSEFSADLGMASDSLWYARERSYRCNSTQKCLIWPRLGQFVSTDLLRGFKSSIFFSRLFFPIENFLLSQSSVVNDLS